MDTERRTHAAPADDHRLGALAALVALVAVGPGRALIVIAVTVVIHHLEAYVIGPKVIGNRAGVHPVVLILGVAVGLKLAGVAGAFLAGPLAAAVSGWIGGGSAAGNHPIVAASERAA